MTLEEALPVVVVVVLVQIEYDSSQDPASLLSLIKDLYALSI